MLGHQATALDRSPKSTYKSHKVKKDGRAFPYPGQGGIECRVGVGCVSEKERPREEPKSRRNEEIETAALIGNEISRQIGDLESTVLRRGSELK